MNDNKTKSVTDLWRQANIAANGRWGVLGMAYVALQHGLTKLAFLFVLLLLLAYVLEQLPARWVAPSALVLAVVTAGLIVMLLISL